jgi:phosphatidylglycerophosphate synthase
MNPAETTNASRFAFIPNLLTALRFALAIAFPFTPHRLRGVVLTAALASEYLDGALARRFGWESRLGRLLDPIADKLLYAVVGVTFFAEGRLDWIALLALGVRDVAVALGAAWLALRGKWRRFLGMRPRFFGKLTTALQYAVLLWIVFDGDPPLALLGATFLAGAVAAAQYFADYRRLKAADRRPTPAVGAGPL